MVWTIARLGERPSWLLTEREDVEKIVKHAKEKGVDIVIGYVSNKTVDRIVRERRRSLHA